MKTVHERFATKFAVAKIRDHKGSSRDVAKELGISRAMFCRIRRGNAWSFA